MTFLAPRLRTRVRVLTPSQSEDDNGFLAIGYTTVLRAWSEFTAIDFSEYIRGAQIGSESTHRFIIRRIAVASLGNELSKAFGYAFNRVADLGLLKTNYFLFVGSDTVGSEFGAGFGGLEFTRTEELRGRLFQIDDVMDEDERKEFINIRATEIEEQSSGYS